MSLSTTKEHHVRIFRNGRNQAIRIPREFEFKGKEAVIRKIGNKLIIEEPHKMNLIELLDSLQPLDEAIPNIDNDLLPLDETEL
jgi:antitoxin VapB